MFLKRAGEKSRSGFRFTFSRSLMIFLTMCVYSMAYPLFSFSVFTLGHIQTTHTQRLSGLGQLLTLDLSGNALIDIPAFSVDLVKLSKLDLSHNRLTRVDVFGSLGESVQEISLKNNIIGYIAVNAFINLTSLTSLDIRHNFITHLQDTLFTPIEVNLERIFLSG